jgi:hypothetical protein
MDMKNKYQSAVERILYTTDRTGPVRQPAAPIPDELVLQDGRRYNVRRLLEGVTRPESVVIGMPKRFRQYDNIARPPSEPKQRKSKYTYQERLWQSHADISELQTRYGFGSYYCRTLQKAAQEYIAKYHGDDTD